MGGLDNKHYGIEGGNDTADNIFLLSEEDACGDLATVYGFTNDRRIYDEARRAKSSTYAKAMGCWSSTDAAEDSSTGYAGDCWWWLRSPGCNTYDAAYVSIVGWISICGTYVNYDYHGVRPALKFNLSSSELLEDAGITMTETTVIDTYAY